MCKYIIYLFYAFMALSQLGFLGGTQDPFLNEIQMEKENQQDTTIKALQATLRDFIPQDLYDRLAKIENQQKSLQTSMEIQHKMIENNMEIQQIALEKIMTFQKKTIKKHIPQDIEQLLAESVAQVLAEQVDIKFQLKNMRKSLSKIEARQRFKAIGLKFYYIEDIVKQNWTTAAQTCRRMGGHLASIQTNEEFLAIKGKINPDFVYWLDINDHSRKGEFMSVASGERVTYLRWLPWEPRYDDDSQRYVNLFNGGMRVENGSNYRNFICQYDDGD